MIPFERQSLGYSKSRRSAITPLLYRNLASKVGRTCFGLKHWLPFLERKDNLILTSACPKHVLRKMKRIKLQTLLLFTTVFLILLIVTIFTVMHYNYVFEADVTIIYLDQQQDVEQTKDAGYFEGSPFNKWNYYEKFKQSGLGLYGEMRKVNSNRTGRIPPPTLEDESGNQGYWIYQNWPTSIATQNVHSSIHLTNFQFFSPHKIAFAIRFYLGGYSRIDISFTGYRKDEMKTIVIRQIGQKNHMTGLCTQHIPIPFEYVKKVSIQAYTFNSTSFVVFDKIALAVGNESRAQNMLYTLLPSQWCKHVRLETQDPLPPPAKKPR